MAKRREVEVAARSVRRDDLIEIEQSSGGDGWDRVVGTYSWDLDEGDELTLVVILLEGSFQEDGTLGLQAVAYDPDELVNAVLGA